mgnify:CR=1 FL=1
MLLAGAAVRYFAEQLTGELGRDPSVRTVANLVATVSSTILNRSSHSINTTKQPVTRQDRTLCGQTAVAVSSPVCFPRLAAVNMLANLPSIQAGGLAKPPAPAIPCLHSRVVPAKKSLETCCWLLVMHSLRHQPNAAAFCALGA